jgi:hypothetical protein
LLKNVTFVVGYVRNSLLLGAFSLMIMFFIENFMLMDFICIQDTAIRIVMKKYYGDSEEGMLSAMQELHDLGCSFLVMGRAANGVFETAEKMVFPPVCPGSFAMSGFASVVVLIALATTCRTFHTRACSDQCPRTYSEMTFPPRLFGSPGLHPRQSEVKTHFGNTAPLSFCSVETAPSLARPKFIRHGK